MERTNARAVAAVEVSGMTRASLLLKGTLAAAAAYGTAVAGPFVSRALAQSGDVEILNFALTLEYLEADFYRRAQALGLSGEALTFARQFGDAESAHVDALTRTIRQLGGRPARKPRFQFPMRDQASFLELAQALEEVGVGAYNGAAPSIRSREVLTAAGGIVQVEARHAAAIRALRDQNPTPNGAFDKTLTKQQALDQAKPFIRS
jgi:hypothetical protein